LLAAAVAAEAAPVVLPVRFEWAEEAQREVLGAIA